MSKKTKIEKKNFILLVFIFFSLFFVLSNAFIMTYPYNKLVGSIMTSGATLSGGSYESKIFVGQPIVGTIEGGNRRMCLGTLCSSIVIQVYDINFTGTLNYSDGSVVATTPIEITIDYQGQKFKGTTITESDGDFFIKLIDLPAYVFGKDLNVTIYVYGKVEAIYECWYNHTSENCCPHETIGLIPC